MKLYPQVEHRDDWWLSWFDGDVQSTRQKLLLAAFREIHFYGYQAASIQNIINQAEVTKGAFYHHFKSKHDMVVALIDEEIQHRIDDLYRYKLKKLATAFRRGQVSGNVKRDVSADSIALFIMATLQGCMGITKSARSVDVLTQCGEGLIHYLHPLRAESDF